MGAVRYWRQVKEDHLPTVSDFQVPHKKATMKLVAVLVLSIGVALCEPQRGGFFGQVSSFFGGRGRRPNNRPQGGGNRRPPPTGNRPPSGNRGRGCQSSGNPTNYNYNGKDYLVSWKANGCANSKWSHSGAAAWCRSNGKTAVSLDSEGKTAEFFGLVQSDRKAYFWTGGRVNHGRNPTITWANGRTTSTRRWSHTGGANRPQPDNRERNEDCLGVLNNFYNDGVKYHDISCHHKKPIICE